MPNEVRLIHAIDLSNWQPWANTASGLIEVIDTLKPRPEHVIVRLSTENERLRSIAVAQLKAVVGASLRPGGYMWCYPSEDPVAAVRAAVAVTRSAGVRVPVLWMDLEETGGGAGTWPGWLRAAARQIRRHRIRPGVYSGSWWWPAHMGDAMFSGMPLWAASYNGRADLDVAAYGDMLLVGHQWTDRTPDGLGLDRDVFLPEFC